MRGPRILVVDDYPDNRDMYAQYLTVAGYDVVEAVDGAYAIKQAVEVRPALIVMDLAMPKINGWDATRLLKTDDRTKDIPILALTGHALEGSLEHSKEVARTAGCDDFLLKPCLPETLLEKVREILSRVTGS